VTVLYRWPGYRIVSGDDGVVLEETAGLGTPQPWRRVKGIAHDVAVTLLASMANDLPMTPPQQQAPQHVHSRDQPEEDP